MTNRTITALVVAVAATVVTATAVSNNWITRNFFAILTSLAWTAFLILNATDRILGRLDAHAEQTAIAITDSHTEGVVEGMRRATPIQPLRGVH